MKSLGKRNAFLDGSFQTFTVSALRSGADFDPALRTKDSLCQLADSVLTRWKE